ncbi:MAG: SWIM zinc finger family protein [Acidimicrobiales bacterium]
MATRRTFGNTWWGQAWLDALEGRAVHDPNRLPRGRTYARKGAADDLTIVPGRIDAVVHGSADEPYDVVLQIRQFRDDEWECVLDAIVAKASHAAALLDGELDPGIVDDAREVEVDILPRSGDLRTACSCPDWAEPCKHAAAVCYLVADALDADPFVLFHLRGMDRCAVIDAIRSRRAGASPDTDAESVPDGAPSAGVDAAEAWARTPGPLPSIPAAAVDGPGRPAPWPSDPPRDAPFTTLGLRTLVTDAARRAWSLRLGVGSDTAALELDAEADLARHAAWASPGALGHLASAGGVTEATLASRAAAWQVAGLDGLRVLDEASWTPPVAEMVNARDQLVSIGVDESRLQVRSNRITISGGHQFRRSRDGRWYLFVKQTGRWTMASSGSADIDDLLGAGGALDD